MEDIQKLRPVLAINLRVAPEWGVITGYTDDGNRFLRRTYFDEEVFHVLESEEAELIHLMRKNAAGIIREGRHTGSG